MGGSVTIAEYGTPMRVLIDERMDRSAVRIVRARLSQGVAYHDRCPDCQGCIAFLRGLHATRNFRPDPVPEEAVNDILQVARWSGSASNVQPWEFLVIRNRETLQKLTEVSPNVRHAGTAPLAIVLVMTGDPAKVPHETYDEGRLAERIMLAAEAHGLGSCIGWSARRR